jgi:4-hydroxybutyrate dehydrogenase
MATINYLTTVQFDFGAVRLAKQECERLGITRPLIVTDQGVAAAGLLSRLTEALPGIDAAVFDGTPPNPT